MESSPAKTCVRAAGRGHGRGHRGVVCSIGISAQRVMCHNADGRALVVVIAATVKAVLEIFHN